MRHLLLPFAAACLAAAVPPARAGAQAAPGPAAARAGEAARQRARAARVTVVRDTWGVAHVYGRSDADAVFGMVYAQAEDDFPRVELNYVTALGRLAEVEGEGEVWRDLRTRMFADPDQLRALYGESPLWLRTLMDAWADGLNYYLATHPEVRPKLLTRFEPWMALAFTEGSIGGDVESVSLAGLERFYGPRGAARPPRPPRPRAARPAAPAVREPGGSNGFAVAPSRTAAGRALLLINPHTSFYFRPEIHVVSEEGLNAYGAVTWGQFFVYQGFNDRAGWMHTSGGGDVIDEYLEKVTERGGRATYRHGAAERVVLRRNVVLAYRRPSGGRGRREVTAYFTHHGPVVRAEGGRWVAVRLMQQPVRALQQSYLRTKARTYADFARVMELRTNSSNNTVYADADGTIAYWHGNFMPVRDTSFDWTRPVDGTDPRADWKGLHGVAETIALRNPESGWIQNTNNAPWQAAGPSSPRPERYPRYMAAQPENPRGAHAVRVLSAERRFTPDKLIAAAYDSYLTAFEPLIPALLKAYDEAPADDSLRARLAEPVAALRAWDLRWGGGLGADVAGGVLGRRPDGPLRRARAGARRVGLRAHGDRHDAARAARGARPGGGAAGARLRHVAHAVGGDQPLPAPHRRPGAAPRRREAEPPGAVHLGALGVARVDRPARPPHDAAHLRRLRQQLRGGRRVRAAGPGPERARRRRERRPGVAALRRPGGGVQPRRPQGRPLLPRGRGAPPRALLPPRRTVTFAGRGPWNHSGRASEAFSCGWSYTAVSRRSRRGRQPRASPSW
jgi:acyl-homoserine-lactone acylase